MGLFAWKKKKDVEHTQTTPPAKTVSVLMQDGKVEEYPEHFMITDGKNCVACSGKLYHTSLDCKYLRDEMLGGRQVKAFNVHDAERQGMEYCYECQKEKDLFEE